MASHKSKAATRYHTTVEQVHALDFLPGTLYYASAHIWRSGDKKREPVFVTRLHGAFAQSEAQARQSAQEQAWQYIATLDPLAIVVRPAAPPAVGTPQP